MLPPMIVAALRVAGYTLEAIRRMSPAYVAKVLKGVKGNNLKPVPGQEVVQGTVRAIPKVGAAAGGLWGISNLTDTPPEITGDGLLVNPDDYSQNMFFGEHSAFNSGRQDDPRYPSYNARLDAEKPIEGEYDSEEEFDKAYSRWIGMRYK